MPEFEIQYKNKTISYEIEGNGTAIVWLHGFMENKKIWKLQKPVFKNSFNNIYIDLLGHGGTEVLNNIHTMEAQTEMVKYVIDRHEISRCSIIGHSMGGYVALAFLEKYAGMVANLVLLNSTSDADSLDKKKNRDRAIKIVKEQKQSYLQMGIVNLFAQNQRKALGQQIENLVQELTNITSEGVIAALEGMKVRLSRTEVLKEFTGKKMIISGINDSVLPLALSQAEAQKTNCSHVVVNGGHMSYIEAPDALNKILLDFL